MDTATCIVALRQNGKTYLGGDSAAINERSLQCSVRKDKKVFQRKDSDEITWQFGFTSSYRMGQLVQYALVLPVIDKQDEKDLFGYMVKKFIPSLQKCFREGGFEKKEQERVSGGTFIVTVKDQIFKIQDNYQVVMETEDFCAAGCGEQFALGAFYATKEIEDAEKRVRTALEAAEAFSAGVCGPFHILSV